MSDEDRRHLFGPGPSSVSQLAHETFALVLAGGRGTRLYELTSRRAKPAVPFGGKFRIIDFALSNCVNSGIRRIGVLTQYKAHSLIRHLQRGWSFLNGRFEEFIDLLPAQQQTGDLWYSGTADAVYQNLMVLHRYRPRLVLVVSGDQIYKMDYGKLLLQHVTSGAEATVACVEVPAADARDFGVIGVDDHDHVISFLEKPADPPTIPGQPGRSLASMGIYVFNADFLEQILNIDKHDANSTHDFGKDVIPSLVGKHKVVAHRFADSCVDMDNTGVPYWRDVGTLDAYWEANIELTRIVPDFNMYDRTWPIWTHQEQLPPCKFVSPHGEGQLGTATDSMVSGGCIISGATVRRSVLFSNVRVETGSYLEDVVALPGVRIGRNCRLRRVVIDGQCEIADGSEIGFDAQRDAERFRVTSRGVTLVTPTMLGQSM